jgi:quinol monooxygenase YgiN
MIVLHSKYEFRPEQRDLAVELIAGMVDESRAEDGVIGYEATVDLRDPNVIHFFDQYEDGATLEAHSQKEHVERFAAELPDLLASEPVITQFRVESRSELDPQIDLDR